MVGLWCDEPMSDSAFASLKEAGLKLFDRAIAWAIGKSVPTGPAGEIRVQILANVSNRTLRGEGASGPVSVKTKKDLSQDHSSARSRQCLLSL